MEVSIMEFGLKGTSRVCRGRHGEVGIVEFGLDVIVKPDFYQSGLCTLSIS